MIQRNHRKQRNRVSSQQKLPNLDLSSINRVTIERLRVNITVQQGDAQFISFRSLNEQNSKFPLPYNSIDSSSHQNSSIQKDLSQKKKIIQLLGKTRYKQEYEYQEVQDNLIKKMRTMKKMQKYVKIIPHRIEPFQNLEKIAQTAQQQQSKKKASFNMLYNGAFFTKLEHKWIPTVRENTMAANYQKRIYIFGGIGSEVFGDMIEYEIQFGNFRELKQKGDIPLNRYGHCMHCIGYPMLLSTQFSYDDLQQSPINGKQLIIFGGEMQFNSALKIRENLSDTRIYDIETETWQQLKPNIENIPESRRSFGSCIIGRGLLIMGGIRSRFSVFNDIYFLNLSLCKWTPLETQKCPFIKGLAFQQLVCVYNKPQYVFDRREAHFKQFKTQDYEGVYCFGGCFIDENKNTQYYSNFVTILKFDQHFNNWIIPETTGQQPQPRIQHTASYIKDMNIIIIFGGRDDQKANPYFNDLFAFKILNKEWIQLDLFGSIPKPRAAHTAIPYKSQILYFGGVNLNGYVEFTVNIAEFNQNLIRQLAAEYRTHEQKNTQEFQQEEQQSQSIINQQYFSLHQITPVQPLKKLTKAEELDLQIKQLSFSNFPKYLK